MKMKPMLVSSAAPSGIKIWSRNGHDMTGRYPEFRSMATHSRQVKYLEWSPAGGLRHATIVEAR